MDIDDIIRTRKSASAWIEDCLMIDPIDNKKSDLFSMCKPIATSEDVLSIFTKDLCTNVVVGEEGICKLIYLALTTRLFDKPVSVAVKGPSAGGKSFIVKNVLNFFPSQHITVSHP